MPPYVLLDKRIGQTPLEAIKEWKVAHPEYAEVPASYAGRLDPMASGLLIVLLGDECKKKDAYLGLEKEYEIEVLLGVGTDTGDVLGIATAAQEVAPPSPSVLTPLLAAEVGAHERAYPAFSSRPIHGNPLFLYALEGTLDTITIPTHTEIIHNIELLSQQTLTSHQLQERITGLLDRTPATDEPSKVLGADFRIRDVSESWQHVLSEERTYPLFSLRVSCASGTYMRSLAARLGTILGTRAIALSIHRTKIGPHSLSS